MRGPLLRKVAIGLWNLLNVRFQAMLGARLSFFEPPSLSDPSGIRVAR